MVWVTGMMIVTRLTTLFKNPFTFVVFVNNVTTQKWEINEHIENLHGWGTNGCDVCDNVIPAE